MKKMMIFGGVLLLIFGALAFVVNYQNSQKLAGKDNPYGTDDLEQATIDQLDNELYQNQILPDELEEKLENGEDVTVYFYSPTCIHCQRTTPELVPLAEQYGIDVVKLNLLEFEAEWGKYNIEGTPTIIHFENGEEAARLHGEQTASTLSPFFEQEVLEEG